MSVPKPMTSVERAMKMAGSGWSVTPGGGIGFSGSAGFNLEPWGSNDPVPAELLDLIARAPRMAIALAGLVRAFEQHLIDEAAEKGVAVRRLCPCYDDELARAKQAMADPKEGG